MAIQATKKSSPAMKILDSLWGIAVFTSIILYVTMLANENSSSGLDSLVGFFFAFVVVIILSIINIIYLLFKKNTSKRPLRIAMYGSALFVAVCYWALMPRLG